MSETKLEVIRFRPEDVIATSGYPLTAGNTYVTSYYEFI